jgi:hypothetical protein
MKLQALASEPQLVKITIDDENIVKAYGESLDFYIYDRQDMNIFMKLATLEGGNDISGITTVIKDLILDEKGEKILTGNSTLPTDVMIKVTEAVVNKLGNTITQTLEG